MVRFSQLVAKDELVEQNTQEVQQVDIQNAVEGSALEKIEDLQKQGDVYTKKTENERKKYIDTCNRIKLAQERLFKLKNSKGGETTETFEQIACHKNIRTLENRLEKVLTKLNETCNSNQKLRDEIQNSRREKVQQIQIREKLDRELYNKTAEAKRSAQLNQSAYDARDRAQRQIEKLKQESIDQMSNFEKEWMEKKHEVEIAQMEMKNHSPKKKNSANVFPLELKDEKNETLRKGVHKRQVDKKLVNETTKNNWNLTKKELDLKKSRDKLSLLDENLFKIRHETGVKITDDLISSFLIAEEQNFSFFNMINDLHTEIESYEVENHKLMDMIEKHKGNGLINDSNRQNIKKTLEDQISNSKQKIDAFEQRYNQAIAIIDSTKSSIISIFNKVGCNDESLGQQLNLTGITDTNIMIILGIIEQRIAEIVQLHNMTTAVYKEDKKDLVNEISSQLSIDKEKRPTLSKLSILHPHPPTTDDFIDSDNEEDEASLKPYSLAEIQEKAILSINRKKDRKFKKTV